MPILSILLIALGLAMDAFAVSITSGISIKNLKKRHALLIGATFGIFQAVMPVLGWALGQWAYQWISAVDYWIAFGLLLFVGGHMIIQSMQPEDKETGPKNPLHLPTLLMLAVATSIDALGVGLSLALLKVDVMAASLLIGAVSLVVSIFGLLGGRRLSRRFGRRVEVLGGLVLIAIGLRIVLTHTIL